MKKSSDMKINIVAFKIGSKPEKSFLRSQNLYNNYGNKNYKIQEFDQNNKDPGYLTYLVINAIIKVTYIGWNLYLIIKLKINLFE